MGLGGVLLRFGATGIRVLEFCAAAIILGIYSYFLAVLSHDNYHIPTWEKAVEGMSGAACLYTIFGVLLTLCLGGVAAFGFIAVVLDILFAGCFAAIAYYTRHGANSCKGFVRTPLGDGPNKADAPGAGDFGYACSLNTAAFAMAIVGIFLFLISAVWQILLVRHHKKEKRYGPSPSNNYTAGSRRPFWKRNKQPKGTRDAEIATSGPLHHNRVSHETGTTMNDGYVPATAEPKYGAGHFNQGTNY